MKSEGGRIWLENVREVRTMKSKADQVIIVDSR